MNFLEFFLILLIIGVIIAGFAISWLIEAWRDQA